MLAVEYVDRARLRGHYWALVERSGVTTALVVDGAAERVARAVYSSSRSADTAASASAIRSTSADW